MPAKTAQCLGVKISAIFTMGDTNINAYPYGYTVSIEYNARVRSHNVWIKDKKDMLNSERKLLSYLQLLLVNSTDDRVANNYPYSVKDDYRYLTNPVSKLMGYFGGESNVATILAALNVYTDNVPTLVGSEEPQEQKPLTCKQCSFWNKSTRECYKAEWVDNDSSVVGTELTHYAKAHDDSGLQSGIRTGPDFGCVLAKPRKTKIK